MESHQFTENDFFYSSYEFMAVGKLCSILRKCQFQG